MGLCHSLRPLLFGDPEDGPRADPQSPLEDAQPGAAPARAAGSDAAGTPLPPGGGQSAASARPSAAKPQGKRRRPEQLRAEEREAAREARRVSRGIDRVLREQKRDLQQTHRLLLLGGKVIWAFGLKSVTKKEDDVWVYARCGSGEELFHD